MFDVVDRIAGYRWDLPRLRADLLELSRAMSADGSAFPLPNLMLSRGARHLCFLAGGRALVVLRGEIAHKDLWRIDLETGAEHQLTRLAPDFEVQDFDISRDGREVVLQRAQVHSEIVLLDLPRR